MPAPVCQLLYCTTVLFKILYCKIKNYFCVFFMYYLCEKYYKPITVQYYITYCVSWVPRLTLLDLMNKLDLRMCSWNGICLYVGGLLYIKQWFSRHWTSSNKEQWFLRDGNQMIWALWLSQLTVLWESPGCSTEIQNSGGAQWTIWVEKMKLWVKGD